MTGTRHQAHELVPANGRDEPDQAVREREARYRLILESATDYAIIATDVDGRVTFWNAGAQNVLGWTATEMVGQPATLIWTPEDRAAGVPENEMLQAREDERAEDERWHLRRDGSRFWAHGLLMPLRGDDDCLIGYLKILRDRTSQHREEEARRILASRQEALAATQRAVDAAGLPVHKGDRFNRQP